MNVGVGGQVCICMQINPQCRQHVTYKITNYNCDNIYYEVRKKNCCLKVSGNFCLFSSQSK